MTDPRWTLDEDTPEQDGVGQLIRYIALATWRADGWLDEDLDGKGMTHRWGAQEFVLRGMTKPVRHALVAAVRDVDTLRQARELAGNLVGCRVLMWSSTVEALVDLLVPAPDTGADHPFESDPDAGPMARWRCRHCGRPRSEHAAPDTGAEP